MYKVETFQKETDNVNWTKNYAIVQNQNTITIQRQNLQNEFFSSYAEKGHRVMTRSGSYFNFCETSFDGVQFIQCDYQLFEKEKLCIDIENEVLEMHFCLSGKSNVYRENKEIDLKTGHNMLTFQNNQQQEICMHPNKNGRFYEIRMGISHFEKLISDFYPSSPKIFSGSPLRITPEMYAVVAQLTNTTYSGKMKALFLEAKMIELFLLQLQQNRNPGSTKPFSFKPPDMDRIYDASQLIERHIDEFITIAQLAQLVGINQRKLMQGFKKLFGCTVYQYINDLKMQTAKSLLLDSNKNVNEVAYHIGYQNSQHFISAFKKKFGFSPGKIKGNK